MIAPYLKLQTRFSPAPFLVPITLINFSFIHI